MVIRYEEILEVVSTLSDDANVRVTVKGSLKGGLIAAVFCILGGLLVGPVGLAVGGAVGGCVAAYLAKNSFKPISTVVAQDLEPEQQQQLARSVRSVVDGLEATDAMVLLSLLQANHVLKARVLQEVAGFVSRELNLNVAA